MTDLDPTPITETTDTPAEKRSSRRILFAVIAALLLIVVAAVLASKAGIDKALVRQQLDMIAAQLKERGAAQGRDITFTYGEIEIKGSFASKHAVIHDPKLAIKPLEQKGFVVEKTDRPQTLLISSPVLEVHPESASLSAMRLSLPQPVNFATIEAPEKSLLKISAVTPIEVHYATVEHDNVPYVQWQFTAPKQIALNYLREQVAVGAEEETPSLKPVYETLNVTMEKGEGDLTIARNNSALGQGTLELKSIVIAPASQPEAGKVTVAQILSQWSNQRNAKNLNVVNSTFTIDRIEAAPELIPYAPISLNIDLTYEGAMPSTPEEVAAIQSQESSFKLKTLSLTTKDATLNATADFVATPEDRLPVGMANVTLTNLPFVLGELKKYQLLDDSNEALTASVLEQVTGVPYAELKDVKVDVNRTRGGSFQIGKTTFEELFAVVLKAALSHKAGMPAVTPVPQLPKEHKPIEPVILPDDHISTRG